MPRISRDRIIHSHGPTIPEGEPTPNIEFEEPNPPIESCDRALGIYIRAWGYVETEFHNLFSDLLGSHVSAARIVATSSIGAQSLREITGTLGTQRLSSKDSASLSVLLRRLGAKTTIRNHVVHGSWLLRIKVGGDKPNTASWERFYEPSDPAILKELSKKQPNQKVASKHIFTATRLIQLAEEAASFAKELKAFRERGALHPFPDVLPVAFSP